MLGYIGFYLSARSEELVDPPVLCARHLQVIE